MAYFADLSANSYPVEVILEAVASTSHTGVTELVNIGWLASRHPYPRGRTSKRFRTKLRTLCASPTLIHRGFFSCKMGFCKLVPLWPQSVGEIIVPGRQRIYIAPSLVDHYVGWHRYQPPQEFVDAVLEQ